MKNEYSEEITKREKTIWEINSSSRTNIEDLNSKTVKLAQELHRLTIINEELNIKYDKDVTVLNTEKEDLKS